MMKVENESLHIAAMYLVSQNINTVSLPERFLLPLSLPLTFALTWLESNSLFELIMVASPGFESSGSRKVNSQNGQKNFKVWIWGYSSLWEASHECRCNLAALVHSVAKAPTKSPPPWQQQLVLLDGLMRNCDIFRRKMILFPQFFVSRMHVGQMSEPPPWQQQLVLLDGLMRNCNIFRWKMILFPQFFVSRMHVGQMSELNNIKRFSQHTNRLFALWDQLSFQEGVLYWRYVPVNGQIYHLQLVVPKSLWKDILKELYEGAMGGHLGEEKLLGQVEVWFY